MQFKLCLFISGSYLALYYFNGLPLLLLLLFLLFVTDLVLLISQILARMGTNLSKLADFIKLVELCNKG